MFWGKIDIGRVDSFAHRRGIRNGLRVDGVIGSKRVNQGCETIFNANAWTYMENGNYFQCASSKRAKSCPSTASRISSCRSDLEALDLIDQATQEEGGGDYGNQYTGALVDNVHEGNETRPDGNSRQRALRKLRKDRPVVRRRPAGVISFPGSELSSAPLRE